MNCVLVSCSALVCVAALGACGGRTLVGEIGDGGAPAPASTDPPAATGSNVPQASNPNPPASTDDASSGLFDVCPPDPPVMGGACPSPNLGCAYYADSPRSCQAFLCTGDGIWQPGPQGC